MIYTIVTDEPLATWCAPLHEGQVIEVIEQSPLKHNPGMTTPIRRRYVSTQSHPGIYTWIEVPCSQGGI